MIFTSEMVHLTAIVTRDHADDVSRALLRVGAVQFNRLSDVAPTLGAKLRQASVDEQRNALSEARHRIESLLQLGGRGAPSVTTVEREPGPVDTSEMNRSLDRLARDVEQFRGRQAELQREINRVSDVRRQLAAFASRGAGGVARELAGDHHRFLDVRYGWLARSAVEQVDRQVAMVSGLLIPLEGETDGVPVLVVSMKRNSAEVERILAEAGFRQGSLPELPEDAGDDALARADERLARLRGEQEEQGARIAAVVKDQSPALERDWRRVRVEELLLSIRGTTSESGHAAVFTGWVPARQRERVEQEVREAAQGACYLEWHAAAEMHDASGATVPVELRNPRFLRPFQMLVTNYGVPEYGTIDPTPLVAISYLLMFGLMFGDAGHGLILVILGIIGSRIMKGPNMRQLSRLLVWCGGASIVMGVLFGAYFGFELLPPLWFDYHGVVAGRAEEGAVRNLLDILTITVYLGVGVIATGLVLNWINRVRKREWRDLFFDKAGVLGGVMYGTGVWVAAAFAQSGFRELPAARVPALLIGVPALLLFLKFPLEHIAARRRGEAPHVSPVMWVMDWVIELLEVFSGYLANTLSFMRVAGLGIAHVMLMVAFFQIAQMISPGGFSVFSVAVLVAGNALVIALEGLSAGIQSLRLNYYEFFSKYFVPTGSVYRPVSLDSPS